MKRTVAVLAAPVLLSLVIDAPQSPQTPARDTQPVRTGTAVLTGRVVTDGGSPVRRAAVRISSFQLRAGRASMTDGDGRYEFHDLAAGEYFMSVGKSGFIAAPRDGDAPASSVKIGEGERARRDFVMVRACAIAGRVLDEYGEPIPDVPVRVLQRRFAWGSGLRLGYAGGYQTTNDLGQYRVYGLQPGNYYVTATPRDSGTFGGMYGTGAPEQTDRSGYAQSYYPGTTSLADAVPVRVAIGQDAMNVDFALTPTRTARVSGTIVDSQGRPATRGSVSLRQIVPGLENASGESGTSFGPDGTFVLSGLAPGEYIINGRMTGPMPESERARLAPNADVVMTTIEAGRARVTVAGNDISGITIQMSKGASVSGELIIDSGTLSPEQTRRIALQSAATDPSWMSSPSGLPSQLGADNRFTMSGLFGPRLFRVAGLPVGWALKAVLLNGRDVTDTPVNFEGREQITGMQIVVTNRVTRINGSVTDSQGQPVQSAMLMVLPQDGDRWGEASRYVTQTVVRNGAFIVNALPPGDYFAVAIDSATQRAMQNMDESDPRQVLRKVGTTFSLTEGETKDLALKVVTKLPELQ